MPTINQLKEWAEARIQQGKGSLHCNHPVCMEEEQEKRIKNQPDQEGKRKTRIAWETNDPECYSLFHQQRERYFKFAGGNPVLATSVVIMALQIQRDEDIKNFIEAIQTVKSRQPGEEG